ncbi:hypothetical protein SmJEL517_g06215 [Synchytrium microbalum]|uniref:TAP-C domain-containing protein n=1 Tax=Synchytrium microbalum TaxID=1806994 RepID=A0A507BWK6_9FUNG|nr:uncharacterized protein SmJEL517_g06215 [Synchytrium microbalum]TPX30156.1 hypothetical protein SmJEL517_g06215 [Synchytrium microbalum]
MAARRRRQGPPQALAPPGPADTRHIPPRPGTMSVLSRLGLPTASSTSGGGPSAPIDRDGDLMMGGAPNTGSSSKRFTPYGKKGIRRVNQPPRIQVANGPPLAVALTGHTGGAEEALLRFVKNRADADAEVVMSDIRHDGKTMYFHVRNQTEFDVLKKLNGIRFAGDKLLFRTVDSLAPRAQTQPGQHIALLAQVVRSRYNAEALFLDLSNIDVDPTLVQAGLSEHRAESSKIWPVICKLIGESCPQVQTISFASNKFRTLEPVSKLPEYVPNIAALSFENNPIDRYRDLEFLKGADLKSLREVCFLETPLRKKELASSGGDLKYRSKITAIFPTINMLDTQPILSEISFDTADSEGSQLPIKPGFFDSENTQNAANDFLQRFYHLLDNNRNGLVDLYDDTAAFSYAIDDSPPPTSVQPNRKSNWGAWNANNRNLRKDTNPEKRVNLIHFGSASIMGVLSRVPQTKHDPTKWLVDAFQTSSPVMLFLTIHGELEEVSNAWKRSFDRVFVIIPAASGSRAANAGFPYVIMNDQWTIRTWRANPSWKSVVARQPPHVTTSVPPPIAGPIVPVVSAMTMASPGILAHRAQYGITDPQHNVVVTLASQTGLNYQFAWQCLVETGWDMARAVEAFTKMRADIPSEAFDPI